MANLLCTCMHNWTHRNCRSLPNWLEPLEPIMQHLKHAFDAQCRIGWDQFFRGRISRQWKTAIETYYHERCPGESYTPNHWMRTTIDALWTFSMTLWQQRNASYLGMDSALTQEKRRKDTAIRTADISCDTIGNITPLHGLILYCNKISKILTWTKQHLDAYLATAEVICEWNVEPG
jgi:hypothetical protein